MHLSNDEYDCIGAMLAGEKTVEGRCNDEKRQLLSVGQYVSFVGGGTIAIAPIVRITKYATLYEYLQNENQWDVLPGVWSEEKAEKLYMKWLPWMKRQRCRELTGSEMCAIELGRVTKHLPRVYNLSPTLDLVHDHGGAVCTLRLRGRPMCDIYTIEDLKQLLDIRWLRRIDTIMTRYSFRVGSGWWKSAEDALLDLRRCNGRDVEFVLNERGRWRIHPSDQVWTNRLVGEDLTHNYVVTEGELIHQVARTFDKVVVQKGVATIWLKDKKVGVKRVGGKDRSYYRQIRWKSSELSGSEWRTSPAGSFDIREIADVKLLPAPVSDCCDQVGCTMRATKKACRLWRASTSEAEGDWDNRYQIFCTTHARRGNCAIDDNDENLKVEDL
jgi:ASC-1-like (ASCH) protein